MLLLLTLACDDTVFGTPTSPVPAEPVPTFHADVLPILETRCTSCHVDGGVGPFALDDYAHAEAFHAAAAASAATGDMPPWPPSDTCNSYVGSRGMDASEVEILQAWSAGGAPEGDPADAVHGTPPAVGLTRVDLSLPLPQPYTPVSGPDDYRCFLLDVTAPTDVFVTGFGVDPDVDAIVHHVIAYLATPDDVATYEALDAEDATPGWECFGGPGADTNPPWLGGWVPGSLGSDYPEGTGIPVPAGSKVVVQMHYNVTFTAAVPDQTSVAFRYETSVESPAAMLRWNDPTWPGGSLVLPPAEPDVGVTYRAVNPLGVSGRIWAAGLHMHLLGKSGDLRVHHDDGTSSCLVDIPEWDFHWQGIYFLDQPVAVGPYDEIEVGCRYDTLGQQDTVYWGEGSADEMCIGIVYATAD